MLKAANIASMIIRMISSSPLLWLRLHVDVMALGRKFTFAVFSIAGAMLIYPLPPWLDGALLSMGLTASASRTCSIYVAIQTSSRGSRKLTFSSIPDMVDSSTGPKHPRASIT
jgi:hypothetical protein